MNKDIYNKGAKAPSLIQEVYQQEHTKILATVIRSCGGDFELAEDALQEAYISAVATWQKTGIPENPGAWLVTIARRKAIDVLRRGQVFQRKQEILKALEEIEEHIRLNKEYNIETDDYLKEDRLRLIFTCCHPAIAPEAQVALTLHSVAGLKAKEIARAFLLPEKTMAQRLVRVKRKIRDAKIPYNIPEKEEMKERLSRVLSVIYLVFNEGYLATEGSSLSRQELCEEAIYLAKTMNELIKNSPEILGLLALMLFTESRREARMSSAGELVTLEEQNRSLWDQSMMKEAQLYLEQALRFATPGYYLFQASIAALHAESKRPEETDWKQIALLYGGLLNITPSVVVQLNRAVAISMADGPEYGIELLKPLEQNPALQKYHLLYSALADLHRRLKQWQEADKYYKKALSLTTNGVEQLYIKRRLKEIAFSI